MTLEVPDPAHDAAQPPATGGWSSWLPGGGDNTPDQAPVVGKAAAPDAAAPDFSNSPLAMPKLELAPRTRAFLQVAITVVLLVALYATYVGVPIVQAGMVVSGPYKNGATISSTAAVTGALLAFVPAFYVFLFLKYNFTK